jgi:solute carrier family 45 protein 1/2/4
MQVDWAVQAALLTPYLLVVGVPYKYYSLVCLCGPIAGLFVQPYMGVFSDHCHSRFGRRRPFIVAGVLLITLGFMLMANAPYLGRLLPGGE